MKDIEMDTEKLGYILIALVIIVVVISLTIGFNFSGEKERQFKLEMAKLGMTEVPVTSENGYNYLCWKPAYSNPPPPIQFETDK